MKPLGHGINATHFSLEQATEKRPKLLSSFTVFL
jgi:hypothetical protein